MWRLLGEKPWQRLVHGTCESRELFAGDVVAPEQRQSRAVCRPLRLVPGLSVLVLPGDECGAALSHVEDGSTKLVPLGAAIGILDRAKRRAFRIPVRILVTRGVLIPAPGRTFDTGRRERADLPDEPRALLLAHGSGRGGLGFAGVRRRERFDDRSLCDLITASDRNPFTCLIDRTRPQKMPDVLVVVDVPKVGVHETRNSRRGRGIPR